MQTRARSQPVKWAELTLCPSQRYAVSTARASLLRPVGILQMAIKMHEVCWNRGEELSHLSRKNKTSERGKKTGRVCRQADPLRIEERASDECERLYGCWCALRKTKDVHLVIYLINLRCVILLCHTSWHLAVKSNALWMFEYFNEAEVIMTNTVQCYKLWNKMNEICL